MSVLDSLAYWMGSPGNSELSDLDATWSPSSHSNYSDQENSMQGSYTGGDSQQQQQLSSSGCSSSGTSPNSSFSGPGGSGPAFTIGSSGPPPGEKHHQHRRGRGVKRVHQRQAANQRERKRMKTINDAFEGLRVRIPMAVADRKLSKVDTLRMAIGYIQQLSELVDSCNSQSGHFPGKAGPENTKVIIRYHNNQGYPEYDENLYGMQQQQQQQYPPLYGHSLSWENENEAKPSPDNKMSAKVWMPQQASQDDLSHLNALS